MDCEEVREILDAYALGAASEQDAGAVEEHVADCLRCWEELSKAQRTAAMLALSVPIEPAPPDLERKLMAAASRERQPAPAKRGLLARVSGWPAAAGVAGVAAVVLLVLTGAMQMQVSDLRNENDTLRSTMQGQSEAVGVIAAPDSRAFLVGTMATTGAVVVYNWSAQQRKGFLHCENLPDVAENEMYKVWFTVAGESYLVGEFTPNNGRCSEVIKFDPVNGWPDAIGLTVGSPEEVERSQSWLMYTTMRALGSPPAPVPQD